MVSDTQVVGGVAGLRGVLGLGNVGVSGFLSLVLWTNMATVPVEVVTFGVGDHTLAGCFTQDLCLGGVESGHDDAPCHIYILLPLPHNTNRPIYTSAFPVPVKVSQRWHRNLHSCNM